MSHISRIELVIDSLTDLKEACKRLGFEFVENQKTYQWYGRYVGDTVLPEGIREEDLGKCDHVINVPECKYEIGVVKQGSHYILLWDSWSAGGLHKKIGKSAGILKQAYAAVKIRSQAVLKKYRITEIRTDKSLRITLAA